MKKILFSLALACAVQVAAQDYPGKNIEVLNDRELVVMRATPNQKEYGYHNFYSDPQLKKVYKKKGFYTKAEAVEGKVFKVVSYSPNGSNYVLKLDNKETGIIYYKYETDNHFRYFFEVVGGENIPDDVFCEQLSIDKTWNSRGAKYIYTSKTGNFNDIIVEETSKNFAMKVTLTDKSDKKEVIKGITLTLENNEQLQFPDVSIETSPSYKDGDYRYDALISLKQQDLDKLTKSKLVKVQIGIHTKEIFEGGLLMRHIRCLVAEKY